MAEEKRDLKTASLIVLTIIVLLVASAAVEYARSGWDKCLADFGPENAKTVKGLTLLFFLLIAVLITVLAVITLVPSPDESILKVYCLGSLLLNSFHIAVVFCILTGLLSYWLVNLLLVLIVLFQGFMVLAMTLGSRFQELAEVGGKFHTRTALSIIGYHLFFAGILVARVVYHFSG